LIKDLREIPLNEVSTRLSSLNHAGYQSVYEGRGLYQLTTCKICSKEVAKSASTCPHCGAKLKMGVFEKVLLLIGVFFVVSIILAFLSMTAYKYNVKTTSINSSPTTNKGDENISSKTIAIGKYFGKQYSITSSFLPILTLKDNNEFKFELGIGMSIEGTYTVDNNNKLVLTSSGGGESYVFGIAEHTLIIEHQIPYVKENTKFALLK